MKRQAAPQGFDVMVGDRLLGVVEEVPGAGWASLTMSGRSVGVFPTPVAAREVLVERARRWSAARG